MTKKIILTIDDSPSCKFEEIFSFLSAKGIQATFFCIGNKIDGNEASLIEAILQGHIIGNHSFSHPHFSRLEIEECLTEISLTDDLIKQLYLDAGFKDYPKVFRFPYGDKGDLKFGHHFWPIKQAFLEHHTLKRSFISVVRAYVGSRRFWEKVEKTGKHRSIQIQKYLYQLGYQQISAIGLNYEFIQSLLKDLDWPWTVDVGEWTYQDKSQADKNIDQIVSGFQEPNPNLGFGNIDEPYGLPVKGSDDILLLHDNKNTFKILKHVVNELIVKGYDIEPPKL